MEYLKEDNIYLLYPKKDINNLKFKDIDYSSKDYCISKDQLYLYLKNKNFYK